MMKTTESARRRTIHVATWTLLAGVAAFAVPAGSAAQTPMDRAIELYDTGQREEAKRALEQLVDGPDEVTARLYLGRIHYGRGEWDDAEDHLERAWELEPRSAEIGYWLGISYMSHINDVSFLKKRGMANRAKDTLLRTLELDPDHIDARLSLAGYYLNAPGIVGGSNDKAREQVAEILARDARRGHIFQAQIHQDEEEWELAWASYQDALALAPDDPEALFQAGMLRQAQESWSEAMDLFDRAAAVALTRENRPFVRQALYQVGRTGALSGQDVDRAITALVDFTERYPEREDILSAGAHWRLGMLHEMKGDLVAARAAYEAALEIDPDQEDAKKALRKLGN